MFRSRPSSHSFPHSLPNRTGFLHLSKHHPSTFMPRSHMWKKETHGTCLSEFGFLHLTWSSPVPSIFPQLTVTRKKKKDSKEKPSLRSSSLTWTKRGDYGKLSCQEERHKANENYMSLFIIHYLVVLGIMLKSSCVLGYCLGPSCVLRSRRYMPLSYYLFVILYRSGMEPRALWTLGKCSTTASWPHALKDGLRGTEISLQGEILLMSSFLMLHGRYFHKGSFTSSLLEEKCVRRVGALHASVIHEIQYPQCIWTSKKPHQVRSQLTSSSAMPQKGSGHCSAIAPHL